MAHTTKSPTRILTAALGLGCLFDLLFYGKLPGVSVLLFVLSLVSALVALGRVEGVSPARRNLWLLLPLTFFASMLAVRTNGFLIFLDLVSCLVLLTLLAYFYAAGRIHHTGMVGYYLALILSAVNSIFRAAPLLSTGIKEMGVSRRGLGKMLPILRGLLIAFPVAILFIILLASADIVFAGYVSSLLTLDFLPDVRAFLWQTVIALAVAWIAAGALVFALSRRDTGEEEPWEIAMSSLPKVIHIGFVEGATVLVVVDLIFLFFGWVQLSYLFGGRSNIAVEGLTYADYARRGFFELLAVSILTVGLIVGLHWLTWRETGRQTLLFRLLASLMAALTLMLLASAFYRMSLYEEAYGYTHLRLYVHLFEVWLAVLLGWLIIMLWLRPRNFALGCFLAGIGFLASVNLLNPDARIAEQNLARYASTGKIDAYYLSVLSEDAVPALISGVDTLKGDDQAWVLYALKEKLDKMESDKGWQELPSLNLSRWQAYSALSGSHDRLAQVSRPDRRPTSREGLSGQDDLLSGW